MGHTGLTIFCRNSIIPGALEWKVKKILDTLNHVTLFKAKKYGLEEFLDFLFYKKMAYVKTKQTNLLKNVKCIINDMIV